MSPGRRFGRDRPISGEPSILIVDDDATLRDRLARALRARGFEVRTAGDYDEADGAGARGVAGDGGRGSAHARALGLELVRDLRALDAETRIVVLTGYGSIATTIDAMKLGAVYYLPKPADADDILAAFARGDGAAARGAAPATSRRPSLERVKWEHINLVLADCGGNVSEAARRLSCTAGRCSACCRNTRPEPEHRRARP